MQWLIDLISEKIMADMQGMIVAWRGAIVDIPSGWALCDGTNGTPDLTLKFIRGAGVGMPVDTLGGHENHTHTFTANSHLHELDSGPWIQSGNGYSEQTKGATTSGTTNTGNSKPPFHALCYIQKL